MPFQPFGYRFDISAPMSPEAAKAAIRKRLKPWFHNGNGARGWVFGSIVCLWASAYDRHGPMIFGLLRADGFGSRLRGRAGSDLNGLAMIAGIAALMPVIAGMAIRDGQGPVTIVPAVILLVALALGLWLGHADRREADPLVRYLESALQPAKAASKRWFGDGALRAGLSLIANDVVVSPVTLDTIHRALIDTGAGDALILAIADERYIQTRGSGPTYLLEARDGSPDRHVRATLSGSRPPDPAIPFDLVFDAFAAFAIDRSMPPEIEWVPVTV